MFEHRMSEHSGLADAAFGVPDAASRICDRYELRDDVMPGAGRFRGGIEVTAELRSNGTRVQRTGTSNGNGSLPQRAQIEIASEAAFRSCATEMLEVAHRG